MLWGRLADSSRFGRKTVLLIGLGGTTLSSIGFAFSTTFWQALLFRSLGGITNGNVGVLRTIISEIVREKKYQSRAFLLMPMTFNIGVIIGPILGGILSDPARSYPSLFGDVEFFKQYPYAAPNLLSAFFLLSAMAAIWLFLEETLDSRLEKHDWGIEIRRKLSAALSRKAPEASYQPLSTQDTITELSPLDSRPGSPRPFVVGERPHSRQHRRQHRRRYTQRLAFRRIFTRNVVFTLLSGFILAFHVGTFNSLWFVFLSTPVYDPSKPPESLHGYPRSLPFIFTGGMGLQPREVGMAMAILGVLGIALQLLVYPRLSARLGTVRSWRIFLVGFPFAYFLVPFLSLVPSSEASPPPHPKSGIAVWLSIAGVLSFQVIGRTFALPAQTILVNNCTPHPSVLGTVHGLGQSVSSFARTIGPVLCGFLYGLGLARGVVGAVWWGLGGVAICGFMASFLVREGDGHEIWLEGDEEDYTG
ncbi:major facilitator superfamily domain-containing protein [Podospora aff. communis PSN243]|uniref:Major facilitator superfamily domain-containing protein n=1 Tax=Podospora aff. communis PSN243 TaxID=3040156 RepID=A0AAV9GKA6_9PEZI|nr:major facilitator superfamily domain-containing protein [Podospora aff. communis PSN243]